MAFESDLRFTSPDQVLADGGKNKKDPEMLGPLGKIPSWKTVDFYMGNYNQSAAYEGRNCSWRNINIGKIDFSGENAVNKNVLLIPDTETLEVTGGVNYESTTESGGGGASTLLDAIKDGISIFTGSTAVPEWSAKTFKDLKPLSLGGEFKFTFKYGSAGLYNAFEEVVKPIIALILFFGIEAGNTDDFSNHIKVAASNVLNPMPTKGQFMAERLKGGIAVAKGDIASDGGLSASTLASNLNKANALIQSALAAGAHEVSTGNRYRNIYMSWGRMTIGPLLYADIKYGFKQVEMDAYGWPLEGWFTVSGLESMRSSTTQALLSPFIQGV